MLVQEHKDKTTTHMVHKVLTWFGQPCVRPRMRDNDSTIQYKILQRTEPDTTIGFPKHPIFPHSLYLYLTTSSLTPSGTFCSSSHLYPPRIVSIGPSPSHVSPFLVSIPYHEHSRSTGYLLFFLTSLSTSYSLYRPISIS